MRNIVFIFILLPFLGLGQGLRNAIAQQGQVSSSTVRLGELKAFPTAFGYGKFSTGGRGGTIYEITNTNNSGAGSAREALEATVPRIIIPKITGRTILSSDVFNDVTNKDFTYWGQFAPGEGLTISNGRYYDDGGGNIIIRHLTWRHGNNGSTPGDKDAITMVNSLGNVYLDHASVGYGFDESLSVRTAGTQSGITIAHTLMGESVPTHNTASILGGTGEGVQNSSNYTYSNNLFADISHRFPNIASNNGIFQVQNNVISNWNFRLSRVNYNAKVDWTNNYVYDGNILKTINLQRLNKYQTLTGSEAPLIYTRQNYIEDIETTPDDNDNDTWTQFTSSGGATEDDPLPEGHFTDTPNSNEGYSPYGLMTAIEAFTVIRGDVGHNRGANADGTTKKVQDVIDSRYLNEIATNTTRSTYRDAEDWDYPALTGNALFDDEDDDNIADNWEALMGFPVDIGESLFGVTITDKPTSFTLHGKEFDNREYTGGTWNDSMNYVGGTLTGNNLYTWLEIYAAYLAGDFELLAEVN